MKKNILIAALSFALLFIICIAYWFGKQPKRTYYPDGAIKTSVDRSFFKENGVGKFYNENGETIQIYNVEKGTKNGPSRIMFGDGEIKFNYIDNNISGDIVIDADEDVEEFSSLTVKAFDGTLKIKKKFNDKIYVKSTAKISCEDEDFVRAMQDFADHRDKDSFIHLAKCLNFEKIKYDSSYEECNITGSFRYPNFQQSALGLCKIDLKSENPSTLDFKIADNNIKINYIDGDKKAEISANIIGDSEDVINALIKAIQKFNKKKMDYETFNNLAGKIEITDAKFTSPDAKCVYGGGFKYPEFTKDTHLECNSKADMDELKRLIQQNPAMNSFFALFADIKNIKTSFSYKTHDDALVYTSNTDNDKFSIKLASKGWKKLIPVFTRYLFSDFSKEETSKIGVAFLKNYTISGYESVMNGQKVGILDGSFNFLDGFSGMLSSNAYINNKLVANITIKGSNLVVRLNYPLSGKPLAALSIKFKNTLNEKYKKTINTFLQNLKDPNFKPDVFAQNALKMEDELNELANTLESVSGTVLNENSMKIVSAAAKIKPGFDITDDNLNPADMFDVNIYTYKNNEIAKIIKVTENGFYADGKSVSEDELMQLIGEEELAKISLKLSDDFEKMTRLFEQGKLNVSLSPMTMGVLAVGGIAGYSKAMQKYRINKTLDQISMMITNIRTLYSAQGNYDGLSEKNAYALGVVPEEMGTNGTLTNPFGGAVKISTYGSSSGREDRQNDTFTVSFENLPREACINIATQDWGFGQTAGFLGIGINKSPSFCTLNNSSNDESVVCVNDNRFTVINAATLCKDYNTIALKYY